MTKITGVHIFEKLGPIEWEDELIAVQAISALSWKKFHGRIELYCNQEHLNSLKKWGVDKLYDKIDTTLLSQSPKEIDRSEYWTFCKLFVTHNLEPPFVLVDTDLWITDELQFDFSYSFIGYHEESFELGGVDKFYQNFDDFICEKYLGYYNTTINPINVALLFWNDKEMIDNWYNVAKEILLGNRKTKLNRTQKTIFLEQWMLAMIAKKLNKKYGTFITPIYDSCNYDYLDDRLWSPPVSEWDDKTKEEFYKIKHVWGLKKSFNDSFVLNGIFNTLLETAKKHNLPEIGYNNLLDFIISRTNYVRPSKKFLSNDVIRVLHITSKIITDDNSISIYNRIKSLYESQYNVEFFVLSFNKEKQNDLLISKIIHIIGSENFIYGHFDSENIIKIIEEKGIDIVQFDYDRYDNEFNSDINILFESKSVKMIKSEKGELFTSNFFNESFIEYPISNKVTNYIENVNYEFDKNSLPYHAQLTSKIKHSVDINSKNVICLLDDIDEISIFFKKTCEYYLSNNPDISIHILINVDINCPTIKDKINQLPSNIKIWLENVDFFEFVLLADLIVNFKSQSSSLPLECISLGIPILDFSNKLQKSSFVHNINNEEKITSKIKNLLYTKTKRIIPERGQSFCEKTYKLYDVVKNM